jgi:hypothetical protein
MLFRVAVLDFFVARVTLMVTDAGAKAKYEANAKAVDHLVRSLCDPEFERVRHLNLS